jgi:NADH-quinone oxidoreductase subunit L
MERARVLREPGGLMAATTFGWLVLLCPLVGTVAIALAYNRITRRSAGWLGTAAIALSFAFSVAALVALLHRSPVHRELTSTLWSYDSSVGVDAKLQILVDPLSVFMAKLPIAAIAFAGVIGAAYYALRLLIVSMHNRVGQQ